MGLKKGEERRKVVLTVVLMEETLSAVISHPVLSHTSQIVGQQR